MTAYHYAIVQRQTGVVIAVFVSRDQARAEIEVRETAEIGRLGLRLVRLRGEAVRS